MAYAAVASLLQTLDLSVAPDAHLTPQDNELLGSLREMLMYLKFFLENNERKQRGLSDLNAFESRIEDAVCRAEDIIELYFYGLRSREKGEKSRRKDKKVFEKHLMQAMEEVESIKREAVKICDDGCGSNNPQSGRYFLGNSSLPAPNCDNIVVGMDSDLLKIKERLIGYPFSLDILTIVGMGGIGKSTLAKIVYDDPYIVHHFCVRAWTTVSQDYHVKSILLGLIHSVAQLTDDVCMQSDDSDQYPAILKDGINQMSDHKLAEQLYRSLKGKPYLIVMDDVWCNTAWDDFRRSFPDDKNGSRIILTSRLTDVASYANPHSPPHQMRFLTMDEGCELLKLKVFSNKKCPHELEKIGKQIAERCRGLPLAIVVVAGHLSKISKKLDVWVSVADNVGSVVARNQKQFLKIIGMSYDHLPHHLKACFLYMGAFLEHVDIPVWRLTALWIAEGFLKHKAEASLEKVAKECLEDLIDRNLILVEKRTNGKITTCRIHDMLRDFCLREAEKEKFWHVVRRHDLYSPEGLKDHRRLCVNSDIDIFSNPVPESSNPQVRTFLSNPVSQLKLLTDSAFARFGFTLLRVLDLITHYFSLFPMEVLKLVHLRFLGLSTSGDLPSPTSSHRSGTGKWCLPFTKQDKHPVSISNLVNLQVLIINWGNRESHCLPLDIQTMQHLRHIRLKGGVAYFDERFLAGTSTTHSLILSSLQTLLNVSSINFSKDIVSLTPNLKKLGLLVPEKNHDQHQHPTDFLNSLSSLHCLETLKLSFNVPRGKSATISKWKAFPPNLKALTLCGGHFPWEDMVTISKISSLEVLKLKSRAFEGRVWETVEGFTELKLLLLENNNVGTWKATRFHFPCLEHLVLRLCNELREIPPDIGEIDNLKMIELYSCGHSVVRSAKRILEEQQNEGNDELEVRINLV